MAGTIIQFPSGNKKTTDEEQTQKQPVDVTEDDGAESPETIDLGELFASSEPQEAQVMEIRNFVDLIKGAQLVAFVDAHTKKLCMLKGSAVFPVMTQQGPRGVQVEIDFPVDPDARKSIDMEDDLLEAIKEAFGSYELLAEEAMKAKQKEMEDKNRIVSASGLPFDPKGTLPFKKQ